MKKFPFEFEGRELHLRKLDLDTKNDLLDRIIAGRLKQAQRMFKKGYLSAVEYIDAKEGAYVKWGTESFVKEFADDENAKAFVRAILIEDVDDATCLRLVKEQRNKESEMALAIDRMREDDDPKAQTPPG